MALKDLFKRRPHSLINTRLTGQFVEQQTALFLSEQQLKLVQKNFHSKRGEIDLIMLDDDCLVFVEVRYRHSATHGSAAETVNRQKQRKLLMTAEFFLQKHVSYQHLSCRFDVVAAQPSKDNGKLEFHWIKNAFSY